MTGDSELIECSQCGEMHRIQDAEIGYGLPDEYSALSENERADRGKASSDFCILDDRHFIRAVLRVPVKGRDQDYGWGVWIEISKEDFGAAVETWNDTDVSHLPKIQGKLANAVNQYRVSMGLSGELELHAEHRPLFRITEDSEFGNDQLEGITETDILSYIHPAK